MNWMPAGIMFLERFLVTNVVNQSRMLFMGLTELILNIYFWCVLLNFINVCILNQAYCMTYFGHLWFLTVMTVWRRFLFHCIKPLVNCCPSFTSMCMIMLNCISLYISVFLCLCLPDWRINVFILRCGRYKRCQCNIIINRSRFCRISFNRS